MVTAPRPDLYYRSIEISLSPELSTDTAPSAPRRTVPSLRKRVRYERRNTSHNTVGHGNVADSSYINATQGWAARKREQVLERNKLAASRCRRRKKGQVQRLESQYQEESDKYEKLVGEMSHLRSDILDLKDEVLKHSQCADGAIGGYLDRIVHVPGDTNITVLTSSTDAILWPTLHYQPVPVFQ
jgi:hypothetical protein